MSDNTANMEWDNFSERLLPVGLQVGNSIFWVSRRGLADCSSVFDTMLYGEFKESKQEIITLSEKEPDEILELLRCLFTNKNGQRKPIDGENVELLVRLGNEYQITDLLDRCWQYIKMKMQESSIDKIVEFVSLAVQYKMKNIVRVGLRRLSMFKREQLVADQAFTTAPLNIRHAVLVIQSFRDSRPTDHDLGYDDYLRISSDVTRYTCTVCDSQAFYYCYSGLALRSNPGKCSICHVCKCKYGETEFVCKCIDAKIESELVNLGL